MPKSSGACVLDANMMRGMASSMSEALDNVSYALLESAIRPDMQPKSSRSHEAEPSGIWMTEGEYQAGLHFPTGLKNCITSSFMLNKNNKYI